jgi:hypothetical protein
VVGLAGRGVMMSGYAGPHFCFFIFHRKMVGTIYLPPCLLLKWGVVNYSGEYLPVAKADSSLLIVLAETKNCSRAIYPLGTFHQKEKTNTCDDAITLTLTVQR